MNTTAKNVFLWIVIVVFVMLAFADFGGANLGGPGGDSVATVGSESITVTEFQRAYRRLEDQFRSTYGEAFNEDLAKQLQLDGHGK